MALVLVLSGISYVGADLATRLQYVVMALLALALGAFVVGAVGTFSVDRLSDNLGNTNTGVGFWEAFAIFFPAVTGFSQGVAMSGDLKSPSRSISRGTFAAVGFSTAVYLAAIVLLAGNATAPELVANTTSIMGEIAPAAWLILAGVLAATLSSALASTLGGPRVLQRLGEDRVLPRIELFARGAGADNNPRRALGLSLVVALITIAAGDLNAVAPVISHVLPGQLRDDQLRHLLRIQGRQHVVSAPVPVGRPPSEPCRHDRLRWCHRGHQPVSPVRSPGLSSSASTAISGDVTCPTAGSTAPVHITTRELVSTCIRWPTSR